MLGGLCACVCVYSGMFMCVRACVHVSAELREHAWWAVCVCVCLCTCVRVSDEQREHAWWAVCVRVCIFGYVYVCACVCMYM